MGRRENRRGPTRREKVKGQEDQKVKKSENRKTERERRREMSPETRELAEAFARVMGWTPEQILPGAENMEVLNQ